MASPALMPEGHTVTAEAPRLAPVLVEAIPLLWTGFAVTVTDVFSLSPFHPQDKRGNTWTWLPDSPIAL